jgi:hypothetical protein
MRLHQRLSVPAREWRLQPTPPLGSSEGLRCLASDYLNHFNQIVMIIEVLEQQPDLAEEIRQWRPLSFIEHFESARRARGGRFLYAGGALHPVARRAFNAVVAGLESLAKEAIKICGPDPLDAAQIEACAKVGVAMRSLLERAMALVEPAAQLTHETAQRRADRHFLES